MVVVTTGDKMVMPFTVLNRALGESGQIEKYKVRTVCMFVCVQGLKLYRN